MKVFLFVIEGLIIKYHKKELTTNNAKRQDDTLVDVYYRWNKMYLFSQKEYFLESELLDFKVLYF
jgi:hypothetical protein